jgi:hypothetical protein
MTARRSGTRKSARPRGRLAQLERQLPATLREFAAELRKRLDRLERDAVKAQVEARRQAAKLLREASHQLGRLEVGGEAAWRRLGATYQKELIRLLGRLERALAPATRKRRPARKKTATSASGPSPAA